MVLDELKGESDDFSFTEDHILFLIDKYRALLLKQKYSNAKDVIPTSNYQKITLELEQYKPINYEFPELYLKSKIQIPFIMNIGIPKFYTKDYYIGDITYVNRDRMKYVGYNKNLQNFIYCSIDPDKYLYLKSTNSQFKYLQQIDCVAIFENSVTASNLIGNDIDILDKEFPFEDSLITLLIDMIMQELSGVAYRPNDSKNNGSDDQAGLSYNVAKSNNQQQ